MRIARFSSVFLALAALYTVGCLDEGDPDTMTGQSPGVTGQVGGNVPAFDGSAPGAGPVVDAAAPINPTGGGTFGGGTFGGGPRSDAGALPQNPGDGGMSADARVSDATVPSDGAMSPGDGGAGGWSPCPGGGMPCKILPLGDSITDGIDRNSTGGYRVQLFRLATMSMKKITYVGSKMNGPEMVDGMPFPRRHEGTSGITIGGLDGRIPMPGLNEIPHIVLLHIGTNDMYMSPSGAPERLGTLIDGVVMGAPDALIVVAKIIPFPGGASAVNTYNNAIPAVVQKRIDAGKHILLIDQFTGFPTSELGDGVHPNQAGYSRMAGKWYEAIVEYLK